MVPEFLEGRVDRSLSVKRSWLGSLSCPSSVSLWLSWHDKFLNGSLPPCVVPREERELCMGLSRDLDFWDSP